MTGIYKFESPTGKVYIGQSFNIKQRENAHRCSYNNRQYNSLLYKSFYKHGFDNHKFSVVHHLPNDVTNKVLTDYEQLYFDLYKDAGFIMLNTCEIVSSPKGVKQSIEHVEKRIKNQIGSKRSEETKAKMRESGRNVAFTEKRKTNISKALVGRKLSDDHRNKISIKSKGRKLPPRSEEYRIKQSISHMGKPSPRKGVALSEKTKKKISESGSKANWIRGKKQSPEHVAKRVSARTATINKTNGLS